MKKRLTISVEEDVLSEIRKYAVNNQVNISTLVEEHFKDLVKPKKNIIEFLKNLPKVDFPYDDDVDLVKQYYEERASKYLTD